jgi:hypothetical protein
LVAVPYRESLDSIDPYHVHVYDEHSFDTVEGFQDTYIVNWHSYNIFMRLQAKLKDMYRIFAGKPLRERVHIIVLFKGLEDFT